MSVWRRLQTRNGCRSRPDGPAVQQWSRSHSVNMPGRSSSSSPTKKKQERKKKIFAENIIIPTSESVEAKESLENKEPTKLVDIKMNSKKIIELEQKKEVNNFHCYFVLVTNTRWGVRCFSVIPQKKDKYCETTSYYCDILNRKFYSFLEFTKTYKGKKISKGRFGGKMTEQTIIKFVQDELHL